jgi:hypothetical protein
MEALAASAAMDRSLHEALQLGCTITLLADLARQCGDAGLVANADAELPAIAAGWPRV